MIKAPLRGELVLLLLVVFMSSEVYALTEINNCSTLNIAGESYILTQDIYTDASPCFFINTNDSSLDLNGYFLRGAKNNTGIEFAKNTKNNLILNGTIENFDNGIFLSGNENTLKELLIIDNNMGIISSRANFTQINKNNFQNNDYAIFIQDGDYKDCSNECFVVPGFNFDSRISNNTFDNNNYSISVSGVVTEFQIFDNIIENSAKFGINIIGTGNRSYTNSQIYRNTLLNNKNGISIENYPDYINLESIFINSGEIGLILINSNIHRMGLSHIINLTYGIINRNSSIDVFNSEIDSSLDCITLGTNTDETPSVIIYNTTLDENKISRGNNSLIAFVEWRMFKVLTPEGDLAENVSIYLDFSYMEELIKEIDTSSNESLEREIISSQPLFDLFLTKRYLLFDHAYNFSNYEFKIYVVENNSKETEFNFNFSSGENNTIIFILMNNTPNVNSLLSRSISGGKTYSDSNSISLTEEISTGEQKLAQEETNVLTTKTKDGNLKDDNYILILGLLLIFILILLVLIKLLI